MAKHPVATLETAIHTVYRLDETTYYPHYNLRGVWISPGFGKFNHKLFSESELIAMQAKPSPMTLWRRLYD